MIKLTQIVEYSDGDKLTPIYIPESVTVRVWLGTTIIDYASEVYRVTESPEEVVRKIMEYKSAVRHHQSALNSGDLELAVMHEQSLNELAGLDGDSDAQ